MVTTAIAIQDAAHCAAIHVNMPIVAPDPQTMDDLTDAERSALAGLQHYSTQDSGYAKQQGTRPQTLGSGLTDSPSGQLAWIVERFWSWTDCDGHPENVLTRDELLDNVMFYWLTGTAASSARLYWESIANPGMAEAKTPTGCSIFPKEIMRPSRRWAEKRFTNLIYWNELDKGGHFVAFEQPETFTREVRDCFRSIRQGRASSRSLAHGGRAVHMPALARIVTQRVVLGESIVPDRHAVVAPAKSAGVDLGERVTVEFVEQE